MCRFTCVLTHILIDRERERDRGRGGLKCAAVGGSDKHGNKVTCSVSSAGQGDRSKWAAQESSTGREFVSEGDNVRPARAPFMERMHASIWTDFFRSPLALVLPPFVILRALPRPSLTALLGGLKILHSHAFIVLEYAAWWGGESLLCMQIGGPGAC